MAAFKSEKDFEKWLAATPSAAKRMQTSAPKFASPTTTSVWPEAIQVKPKLATSNGTSVVVKLPVRTTPTNHYAAFVSKFDRAMAWVFVGVVATGSMGVVATVSAMLALEYLR